MAAPGILGQLCGRYLKGESPHEIVEEKYPLARRTSG